MSLDDRVGRADFERAFRFANDRAMTRSHAAQRVEGLLLSLIRALIEAGKMDRATFEAHLATPRPAPPPDQRPLRVELGKPVDKYQVGSPPELDCAALLPICGARCCMLGFALSPQDLEEGGVAWSYRQPYQIQQAADHRCVHQDRARGGCTVYAIRPAICRSYDCRDDKRVWLDFARKIPAPLEDVMPRRPGP